MALVLPATLDGLSGGRRVRAYGDRRTFFVKEHLGLSASFLAGLTFWAGLPWALKMPLGHLVDLLWRWKDLLNYLGAALIALSLAMMYGLIAHIPPRSWLSRPGSS
jgi:hypothetical protein